MAYQLTADTKTDVTLKDENAFSFGGQNIVLPPKPGGSSNLVMYGALALLAAGLVWAITRSKG